MTYTLTVGIGVVGYGLFIFLGITDFSGARSRLHGTVVHLQGACVLLLWYGLYFGVLGRDCAEVAADRMVGPRHAASRGMKPPHSLMTSTVWPRPYT